LLGNLQQEILTLRDDQREKPSIRTVDMGLNSLCLAEANRKDCPVFVEQAAQCIHQLGPLTHQPLTGSEDCGARLLLFALGRDKTHLRLPCCTNDRFSIGRVVFLASNKRLE
jgi:hypothetical protein